MDEQPYPLLFIYTDRLYIISREILRPTAERHLHSNIPPRHLYMKPPSITAHKYIAPGISLDGSNIKGDLILSVRPIRTIIGRLKSRRQRVINADTLPCTHP